MIRLSLVAMSVSATSPDIDDSDLAERHLAAVIARRAVAFCATVENLAHRGQFRMRPIALCAVGDCRLKCGLPDLPPLLAV